MRTKFKLINISSLLCTGLLSVTAYPSLPSAGQMPYCISQFLSESPSILYTHSTLHIISAKLFNVFICTCNQFTCIFVLYK